MRCLSGANADPLSVRWVDLQTEMAVLLIIVFVTIGLAVRAGTYGRLWSPVDSESDNERGLHEMGIVDTCARTFVLVLLFGLLPLVWVCGNILASARRTGESDRVQLRVRFRFRAGGLFFHKRPPAPGGRSAPKTPLPWWAPKKKQGSPRNRFVREIDALALDLAWSLWAELGVDGAVRRHDWQAIDLKRLLFLPAPGGVAENGCPESHRLVHRKRAIRIGVPSKNLADQARPETRTAFGRFAATVRTHAKTPWPGQGDPLTLFHPERRGSPDLRRPSLVQLRLRALVGVSARAEILKLMLADPDQAQPASTLAEDAAYGKGSVAHSLEMLTLAGIVQVRPQPLLYRLARPGELAQALQWLPSVFPDWWPVFSVVESLMDYAHGTPGPGSTRLESLQQLLKQIDPNLHRLGISEQVPRPVVPASVAEFEHWALNFADSNPPRPGDRLVSRGLLCHSPPFVRRLGRNHQRNGTPAATLSSQPRRTWIKQPERRSSST